MLQQITIHIPSEQGMFPELWLTFWQGFRKVMIKHTSSNINRTFLQSYVVINNVLKMLAQKLIYTSFMEHFCFKRFSWTVV